MTEQNTRIDVVGVGSPVVDLLAEVSEETLQGVAGAKGGMELIDAEQMQALLNYIGTTPTRGAGGSAGNTVFTVAEMGLKTTILGKLGDDENGRFYRDQFAKVGGDTSRFKTAEGVPTARSLCLITPDSERTMRTDLGAAATLAADEIGERDFQGCRLAHLEGYLLFNRELLYAVLQAAKAAGCTISMDLGSFEVVRIAEDILPQMLSDYVDIVFANEEEAAAYAKTDSPEEGLTSLGKSCSVVAVKMGGEGALLKDGQERCSVPAIKVEDVVDTTGAGDIWASGFLYGYLKGHSLKACGEIAAVLGGEAVRQVGASLTPECWADARERLPDSL